jgi:hypothetical protein
VPAPNPPKRDLWCFLLFALLPAALLAECVFGGKHYLPYDLAEFPPVATTLTPAQRQELRATANYDATEPPIWFAIELQLAREALLRGQLPHWNPYVRNGAPMLAHGHLGFLNPLHWPALLPAEPATGLLVLTWTMLALAGALMFGLLRHLRLSLLAACFGGIAYTLSGTLAANAHWFMRLEPLALLPGLWWALLAIAARDGRARRWPALGFAAGIACTWLSGFPQYGIPCTLLAMALGVLLCLRHWRLHGFRQALQLAGWYLAAGACGLLLAMPGLLPMLEFYPQSNRPIDESLDRASRHALAPMAALGYLFPELFSHPGDYRLPQDSAPLPWLWSSLRHWTTGEPLLPNYNFTEYAVFPGTLPLLCAALACCRNGNRARWLALAGLAAVWLLATGAFGCWQAFLLPGLKTVPPYRCLGPAAAFVAILAAIGLEALRQQGHRVPLRALAVLLCAAGAYCLAESTHPVPRTQPDDPWLQRIVEQHGAAYANSRGIPVEQVTTASALQHLFTVAAPTPDQQPIDAIARGRERLQDNFFRSGIAALLGAGFLLLVSWRQRQGLGWPTLLVVAVTTFELGSHAWSLNRGQALPHGHDSVVHEFLRQQRDQRQHQSGLLVGRGAGAYGAYALPGGTLAREHIRDLNFYTFVDNRSDLPIRALYGDAQILRGFVCDALPDDPRLALPYWDLIGLRYVLATAPMQHAGTRVGPELRGPHGEFFIYERPRALSRGFTVPQLRVLDGIEAQVQALIQPELEPKDAVIVNSADATLLPKLPATARGGERWTELVHEDSRRIVFRVADGDPAYLVVQDTFFAGWSAKVDGKPTPIARGNLAQRVVAVPAGECAVEFVYNTPGLQTGAWLAGLALATIAVALGWPRRRAPEQIAN